MSRQTIVVITGAGSGIGAAICHAHLPRSGAADIAVDGGLKLS